MNDRSNTSYDPDEGPKDNYVERLLDEADYRRDERKEREMEELWAKSRILTPETDENTYPKDFYQDCRNLVPASFARDLERRLTAEKARAETMGRLAHAAACESAELRSRLTVAREALKQIQHNPGNMDMEVGFLSGHIAAAALNQTAHKP